jgi:YVTN family beta-propeller protein
MRAPTLRPLLAAAGFVVLAALGASLVTSRPATADSAPRAPASAAPPGPSAVPGTSGRIDQGRPASPVYKSPNDLVLSKDGARAYLVNATADSVSVVDTKERRVLAEIPVGARPASAALSVDEKQLFVTCSWANRVDVVDLATAKVARSIEVRDEPYGVVALHDGARLAVLGTLSGTLSFVDLAKGAVTNTLDVGSQPRFLVETADGKRLVVANGLSRSLVVIDVASEREVDRRDLGRASLLRHLAVTKDGRWAIVASVLSHDETFSMQMERGWIHSNGLTVVDLERPGHRATILLDKLLFGAANPTGVALSQDEKTAYVTISGTHEVAIVDVPRLLELAASATTPERVKALEEDVEAADREKLARRVPAGGLGPRGIVKSEAAGELFVADYFADAVAVLDAESGKLRATIPLGPPQETSLWRRGELLSTDARITYQGWFTCVSCHQEDMTVDGLSWDMPNDGLGNPKSAKSLHDAFDTAPAMWSGVRADLDAATQAGERFQGFLPQKENHPALMEYLQNPERAPNPWRGRAPEAEARGKRLFTEVGCDCCHVPPRFTDQKPHDVGLGTDHYRTRFDTPSIREVLRTGPYLHDGRAKTLKGIFTDHNPKNLHGRTKGLSDAELDDLVTYLRTL